MSPGLQTLVELIGPLNHVLPLVFEHVDSRTLSVTVVLGLRKLGAALVNRLLVLLAQVVLLHDALVQVLLFPL